MRIVVVPNVEHPDPRGLVVDTVNHAKAMLKHCGVGAIAYVDDKEGDGNVVVAGYCDGNGEIVWKP